MELYPFPAQLVHRLAQGESISPTDYDAAREQIIADERAIRMAIKRHVLRTARYDGRRWEAIVRLSRQAGLTNLGLKLPRAR